MTVKPAATQRRGKHGLGEAETLPH